MIGWLKRAYHRWRARGWTYEGHSDCIWMHGPCGLCRHRILSNGGRPDQVHALALNALLPTPGALERLTGAQFPELSPEEKDEIMRIVDDPDVWDTGID